MFQAAILGWAPVLKQNQGGVFVLRKQTRGGLALGGNLTKENNDNVKEPKVIVLTKET